MREAGCRIFLLLGGSSEGEKVNRYIKNNRNNFDHLSSFHVTRNSFYSYLFFPDGLK